MAEMAKVITGLEQNKESYNLGATFNNVFLDEEDDFSLKDLYDHYDKVLKNCDFISYGVREPKNINIWYHLFPDAISTWEPLSTEDFSSWTTPIDSPFTGERKEIICLPPLSLEDKKENLRLNGELWIQRTYNNITTIGMVEVNNIPMVWNSNFFSVAREDILEIVHQNNEEWTDISFGFYDRAIGKFILILDD